MNSLFLYLMVDFRKRIDQMEAQLASLTAWVHKSVADKPDRVDGVKSSSTSDGDTYSTASSE